MVSALLIFAELTTLLYEILEKPYKAAGRRTEEAVDKCEFYKLSWKDHHFEQFMGLQEQLLHAVREAHRNPGKEVCIHTDARDAIWSSGVTHCMPNELG